MRLVDLRHMTISDDGMTVLAPGLASLRLLKKLDLSSNNIGDEGLGALAAAQRDFRYLEKLFLGSSKTFSGTGQLLHLGSNATFSAVGLKALSRVLQTVSSLKTLDLRTNSIDDEGLHAFMMWVDERFTIHSLILTNNAISTVGPFTASKRSPLCRLDLQDNTIGDNDGAMEALAEGMKRLRNLEYLKLNRVSSSALSVLATVFRSEKCSLQTLDLFEPEIEDSGAIALANGLKGNQSLTKVCFDRKSLTDVGWSAFEKLLCDTSSVNNTYCSNHTLEEIGYIHYGLPPSIKALLELNKQEDQGVNVPIRKILMSHSEFDMTPLLQWKLKLLPFVVTWFDYVRSRSGQPIRSRTEFQKRKLSAVFQYRRSFSLSS